MLYCRLTGLAPGVVLFQKMIHLNLEPLSESEFRLILRLDQGIFFLIIGLSITDQENKWHLHRLQVSLSYMSSILALRKNDVIVIHFHIYVSHYIVIDPCKILINLKFNYFM